MGVSTATYSGNISGVFYSVRSKKKDAVNFCSKDYGFGFNGKENDNEVKGYGNSIDYGARIYDPRLGRFLSVDPLTKAYSELSPYQFASLNPIYYVDLDGKEGESYLEYKIDEITGEKKYLRRVVEVNIYQGVTNNLSSNGFYVADDPESMEQFRRAQEQEMNTELNQRGLIDKEQNVPIVFRICVTLFDVDALSASNVVKETGHTEMVKAEDYETSYNMGIKSAVMIQEDLGALKLDAAGNVVPNVSFKQGEYKSGIITINSHGVDKKHTKGHEIGHFMLRAHPDPNFSEMTDPDINIDHQLHNAAGGIFTIGTVEYDRRTKTSTMTGTQPLDQNNVDEILKSVIKTKDRQVDE